MNRRRLKRSLVLCGVLILLVGTASPWLYKLHVETEFKSFMRARVPDQDFDVKESRCLGKTSNRIRLWPILKSKRSGSYPYLSQMKDPIGKSYMQVAYFHGYWFNYCKLVQLNGRVLIAYWSLKEDRWHLGELHWLNPKCVWEEYDRSAQQSPQRDVVTHARQP